MKTQKSRIYDRTTVLILYVVAVALCVMLALASCSTPAAGYCSKGKCSARGTGTQLWKSGFSPR